MVERVISFKADEEFAEVLELVAVRLGVSKSEVIREALRKFLSIVEAAEKEAKYLALYECVESLVILRIVHPRALDAMHMVLCNNISPSIAARENTLSTDSLNSYIARFRRIAGSEKRLRFILKKIYGELLKIIPTDPNLCPYCGKILSSRGALTIHLKHHREIHDIAEQLMRCLK